MEHIKKLVSGTKDFVKTCKTVINLKDECIIPIDKFVGVHVTGRMSTLHNKTHTGFLFSGVITTNPTLDKQDVDIKVNILESMPWTRINGRDVKGLGHTIYLGHMPTNGALFDYCKAFDDASIRTNSFVISMPINHLSWDAQNNVITTHTKDAHGHIVAHTERVMTKFSHCTLSIKPVSVTVKPAK